MPRELRIDPAVVRLTTRAAKKMPGQTSYPRSKIAASAIPVPGHTAVALG
jgi:hypothetical protein